MVLKQNMLAERKAVVFENDVEMYGAQTETVQKVLTKEFENDVEMYGAQTARAVCSTHVGLRMM